MVARDWVWGADLIDLPASQDVLQVLRHVLHDNTPVFHKAGQPFVPIDLLKIVASYLEYWAPRPSSVGSACAALSSHPSG
jgi:hypothetical protein